MNTQSFRLFVATACVMAFIGLSGCQTLKDEASWDAAPVSFSGKVYMTSSVTTRADGLDPVYIKSDPFDMDFYIQLNTEGKDPEYGTYVIPSGYEGQFQPEDNQEGLKWQSLDGKHVFYGWNITWDPDPIQTNAESLKTVLPNGEKPSAPKSADLISVFFYNSEGDTGYQEFRNNAYLENFIGTVTKPFVYKNHGKYVEMTFHHLVSKIKVNQFILLENSGTIQKDLEANITFINMPTSATFHPHPKDGGRPCVSDPKKSPDEGVTFYIKNDPGTDDVFYVCPEIDFSTVDYKIQLTTKRDGYSDRDTYYGTFENVNFIRKEGWGYDQPDKNDIKTLHAGEEMTVNITLIPGQGPGLSVIISPWSTEKPQESQYHTYPGFYTESELNELRDLFLDLLSTNDEETLAKMEQLFELYGVTEDGIKYFMLYENLDVSKIKDGNIFPIWKEYVLNGLGHTITLKTNSGNYWGTGNKPYFNTGPVRDIYFTDPNGNNTIYIDKDGFVWVTKDGQLTKTANQLQDLKTYDGGKWNSYDINAETGEIRYSTYFNNHITG